MSSNEAIPPPTVSGMVMVDETMFTHSSRVLYCGCDVEHGKLVCALALVKGCVLDRVAGISQVDKVDALDHAPIFHIQAWHDLDRVHVCSFLLCVRSASPAVISYSVSQLSQEDGR